uniref:Uncharacterized protein n=1 Tax=Gopherus evgoodei TaxID=1825980 RepID=A0A8C4VM97_9SAUR
MELPGGPYVNYVQSELPKNKPPDFISCCVILVNPTTLSWGHTSCQHYLLCDGCPLEQTSVHNVEKKWEEITDVKVILKLATETLFPEHVVKRLALAVSPWWLGHGRSVPGQLVVRLIQKAR